MSSTNTIPPESAEIDRGILADQVGFNLRLAYFNTTQLFTDELGDLFITPIQFAILEVAANNDGLKQRQIARLVGTAPSVLVDPINKLERRGLLTRERDPQDLRRHQVKLTAAGLAFQRQARERINTVENTLAHALTADERDTLLALLQRIVAANESR
jgi:DNA-binding MarR family transcriptional regulator